MQNYTGGKEFENIVQRQEMYTQIKRQLKKHSIVLSKIDENRCKQTVASLP